MLVSVLTACLVASLAACTGEDDPTAVEPTGTPTAGVAGETATPQATSESTTDASTGSTSTPSPGIDPQERLHGIASIIPPNFPTPSEDDWREFLGALPDLGELAGNYAGWSAQTGFADLERNGELLDSVEGVAVLYGTGFHQDAGAEVALTVDFADPAQAQQFTDDLVAFVTAHRPLLLGIGNEVNRVWEADPQAFEAWAAALPGMVDAIHAVAPETQVFVTFQYEFLRGGGAITGVTREPQWDLLDAVTGAVDLVAFTTYPFFDYETPEALPDDYYTEGAIRAGIPVAFTEIGWPSAPIEPLEGSPLAGLGGTPEEQAAFIDRLPALLRDVSPAFLMWAWPFDTEAVGPTFDSLGLAWSDGTHKPAWEEWVDLARR